MRAQQVVVEARQFSLFEAVDLPRISSRLRSCEGGWRVHVGWLLANRETSALRGFQRPRSASATLCTHMCFQLAPGNQLAAS
jgi:hypothetical protein